MTWEPSSLLPQVLIDEFDNGTSNTKLVITDISFGVVNHTLIVEPSDVECGPPSKKSKAPNPPSNPGYV